MVELVLYIAVNSCQKTRLLDDEGHGGAFVEQPQLAGGVLRVARVAVDAAVQQRAVEVAHQGADVPADFLAEQKNIICRNLIYMKLYSYFYSLEVLRLSTDWKTSRCHYTAAENGGCRQAKWIWTVAGPMWLFLKQQTEQKSYRDE